MKTNKKLTSFCLVLAMLISMFSAVTVFAATNGKIQVGKTTAYRNSTVDVAISMPENPGIVSMMLSLNYDKSALTLKKVEDKGILGAKMHSDDLSAMPYTLSWANDTATSNYTSTGDLVILTFDVLENAEFKEYPITLSYDNTQFDIYDVDLGTVDFDITNGSITVQDVPKLDFDSSIKLVDKDFTYDGTEKTIAITGTLPTGVNAKVTYENETATNVGTYTVTATLTADGYNTKDLTATMKILPKKLTVLGLTAQNKTYDSTKNATLTGGVLDGVVSGDDVKADIPVSGIFEKSDIGDSISVIISDITLSGSDKDNYTLTQPTGLTANITKAPITIKANDIQMIEGGSVPALEYTIVSGNLFGDDEIYGNLETVADGTQTGEFDITQGTVSVSDNYDLKYEKGTLSVVDKTPQNIIVSAISEKTYGDGPFAVSVTADSTSGLEDFIYESSNTNVADISSDGIITIKSAGETDISVKQSGNNEYAPYSNTQKLIVKKVDIIVNADAKTKIKGQDDPTLTYTYTGVLVGEDIFTGSLERESGENIGKYDILIGTLALNENYNIIYNKALFEISDKKSQDIKVASIGEKTYGDEAFKLNVTPDSTSGLSNFVYESDNTNVAEIANDGAVTIKSAGEANITIKQEGNGTYAPFEKTQKLVVKRFAITITADAKTKKVSAKDPELTYTYTGSLVGEDKFTGNLTREEGEQIGEYKISQGTLSAGNNYEITFIGAMFKIVDKTPQTLTIEPVSEKVYGDEPFEMVATATSGLQNFTYESSNTNVAEINANGIVTIKAAGETEITVSQAGNDEYAATSNKVTLVINKKGAEITAINVEDETASFTEGLTKDDLDFAKLNVSKAFEGTEVTVTVTNFVLKGEKANNYIIVTPSLSYNAVAEASTETEITEGITATTVVYGDTAKVDITDSSALTEDTAVIDLTAEDVNAVAISAEDLKNFADNDKAIEIKVKDETGKDTSITFNKAALNAITNGVTEDVTIRISNPDDSDLTVDQQDKKTEVSAKNPVVYSLTVEGAATTDFSGNNVTVTLYYDKGTTNGNIVVKFIKDDGTEELITNNANYNSTDKTITVSLGHFSEYLVYTEPQSSHRSGGGRASSSVTVKFNTNGGDEMKNITVTKGQTIGTIKTPTRNGYVFTGWYSDEKLTKEYSVNEKVTESTTLYAGWKIDPVRQLILTIGKKEAAVWNEAKSNDVAPVIRNDRTMLPARFVAENLGATVEWVGEEQKVVITKDDNIIILYINSDKAYVNNEEVTLDSPAFIENDRTYTPLRFIAEKLGADVDWNGETQEVTITKQITEKEGTNK